MAKHKISQAGSLFQGKVYQATLYANNGGSSGVPVVLLTKVTIGAPIVADADGVAEAQAVAGAGNLTINGALASGGVATFDVPRAVRVVSSDAGDTTQTATFTGTDQYGAALVETLTFNGTTVVNGKKAFKTVSQVAVSAVMTGNASAGTTNILGLPYKLSSTADLLVFQGNGVTEVATKVAAVTTDPATATTGDVRGTVVPNTTPNGSVVFTAWMYVDDKDTLGVAQYGG